MITNESKKTSHTASGMGHWEISGIIANQAIVLSILMYAAGFFLCFEYVKVLDGRASLLDGWAGTPLGLALSLPAFILHELLHGLGYWWAKAKPKYGFLIVGGTLAFYTTAPGQWMTRLQYTVVIVVPVIGVNVIGLLLMAFLPHVRYGLLTALALHLGGCAGDIFFLWELFHLPKQALFQDTMNGFDYRL